MKKNLTLDTRYMKGFVSEEDLGKIFPEVEKAHDMLLRKNGPGSEFLGWMDLPENIGGQLLDDIERTASEVRSKFDALVCIGIGGSYLGARAAIQMLCPEFEEQTIFFAGQNLSGEHIKNMLDKLADKNVCVNVISKSGTTMEPAIAFRIIEDFLVKKHGPEGTKERIICTTDGQKGALKALADRKG